MKNSLPLSRRKFTAQTMRELQGMIVMTRTARRLVALHIQLAYVEGELYGSQQTNKIYQRTEKSIKRLTVRKKK